MSLPCMAWKWGLAKMRPYPTCKRVLIEAENSGTKPTGSRVKNDKDSMLEDHVKVVVCES